MKLRATIAILTLIIAYDTSGQTIGDDINFIRSERVGGEERYYEDGLTYEFYDKATNLTWLYFLDSDSVCQQIAIHPESHLAKTQFISFLNNEMLPSDGKHWFFERGNEEVLSVTLQDDERSGSLFLIGKLE